MAYPPNDDLKRALEALTLFRVWAAAYSDGGVSEPAPASGRDGQFKSPFRDDGKNGSFSICHEGRGFKDFGGDGQKGGVWRFAQLCWPMLESKDLAVKLIELSGISPTVQRPPLPREPGAAADVDPMVAKAAKTIERSAKLRAAEDRIYEERAEQLRPPAVKAMLPWPACARVQYNEGLEYFAANPKKMDELAESRGWPEEWARQLVELGLISYPLERWAIAGESYAKRQRAFLVQAPRHKWHGTVTTTLDEVGYHQRGYVPPRDGKPEKKLWLYVPSLPKDHVKGGLGAPRSPLERETIAWAREMKFEVERMPALVQPLPFVLGDVQAPKVVVLLEGQWDAITFFGASGYFHDTTPSDGLAVFGIRGAQGMDAFLGHWAEWLRKHKPRVWVIADNDAAGGSWREAPKAEPGLPRPPGLAERLVAAGGRAPLISWLTPGPWGKDFNDYYKAAKPTPAKMHAWMRKTGIMAANGGWA